MTGIEGRLVRYAELRACTNAFVDTRTPGSDRKENFTIVGPGVSENPNQHVHIPEPHGFNIGAARQPGGCLNSQHSHETADGFPAGPVTGWWRHGFNLRCLKLATGAVVPAHVRGEEEVVFVHSGTLAVTTDRGTATMAAGDTFTTPKGAARSFRALSSDGVVAYVVRGGDAAGPVRFVGAKAA